MHKNPFIILLILSFSLILNIGLLKTLGTIKVMPTAIQEIMIMQNIFRGFIILIAKQLSFKSSRVFKK